MRKVKWYVVLALILVPLVAAASPLDTVKKALGYLQSVQEENGSWARAKQEFPGEVEPASWAVKVLSMNGAAPEQVAKGIDFILKDQKADGGWNNNSAHTGFAILALRQAGKGQDAVAKAIAYLRSIQDHEGGFKRIGKEGAPLTIYTAVVLCALKEAGVQRADGTVRQALDWLMGCQNPDGGYGMPKGTPSLAVSTAWTVRALLAYGVAPTSPFVQDAVEWLLKVQKPSGGFSVVPPAPEDPEVTAYVIMALSGLKDKKPQVDKGAEYLAKVQQADGAYISNTPMQFNKVAKKNTQSTAFVAWALSELK